MPVNSFNSVRCECGCYVGKYYLKKHKTTKKHNKLMESSISTIEQVSVMMSELYDRCEYMSDGDYLSESNRLKSIYDRLRRTDYLASLNVR